MGGDADRLLDDDEVIIVQEDAHAFDRLGCALRLGIREGDVEPLALREPVGLHRDRVIDEHSTVLDERSGRAAREPEHPREADIDAFAGEALRHGKSARPGGTAKRSLPGFLMHRWSSARPACP